MKRGYRIRQEGSHLLPQTGGGSRRGNPPLHCNKPSLASPTPALPRVGGGGERSVLARATLLLMLATLALAPAACGRKGEPVLPPGQTDQFPSKYPKSTDPQTGVFSS
jgi:predicted small lipoprotein YifL